MLYTQLYDHKENKIEIKEEYPNIRVLFFYLYFISQYIYYIIIKVDYHIIQADY